MYKDLMKLKSGTDIRGVALEGEPGQPVQLTDETVYGIMRAFAKWASDKCGKTGLTVAVGRDCRLSGERIEAQAVKALCDSGFNVIRCGLCTTPAMFMTTVLKDCDAALSITASHHPYNRNGLKFFTCGGGLEGSDITDILNITLSGGKIDGSGSVTDCGFLDEYAAYLRKLICSSLGSSEEEKPLKNLKFAVDAGNGAGGFYAEKVLKPLGADTSGSINLEPDGRFPNHIPNPENEYAMECACKATVAASADLGIIFDTDVDRAGAVGPDGEEINRNRLVALAAVLACEDCPNGTIVTDSITSSGLKIFIENELHAKHYRYRRGYKNVIDKAIELCAEGEISPLAIETSGHAAFRSNYFLDDGAYLITRIVVKLAQLKAQGKTISDLISTLKEPVERKEIRFNITESDFRPVGEAVIGALERFSALHDGWQIADDNREGIRVNCSDADGWFLLRLSVHDPVMPMNFESDTAGGVEKMISELKPFFAEQKGLDVSVLM